MRNHSCFLEARLHQITLECAHKYIYIYIHTYIHTYTHIAAHVCVLCLRHCNYEVYLKYLQDVRVEKIRGIMLGPMVLSLFVGPLQLDVEKGTAPSQSEPTWTQ